MCPSLTFNFRSYVVAIIPSPTLVFAISPSHSCLLTHFTLSAAIPSGFKHKGPLASVTLITRTTTMGKTVRLISRSPTMSEKKPAGVYREQARYRVLNFSRNDSFAGALFTAIHPRTCNEIRANHYFDDSHSRTVSHRVESHLKSRE